MGFFGRRKTQGRVFGAEKKTLREWPHAIPRFSIKTGFWAAEKPRGVFWGAERAPAGSTRTHTLVLGGKVTLGLLLLLSVPAVQWL